MSAVGKSPFHDASLPVYFLCYKTDFECDASWWCLSGEGLWACQEGQMGQKMVRFGQLGAARSRQDESIEVEVNWGRNGRLWGAMGVFWLLLTFASCLREESLRVRVSCCDAPCRTADLSRPCCVLLRLHSRYALCVSLSRLVGPDPGGDAPWAMGHGKAASAEPGPKPEPLPVAPPAPLQQQVVQCCSSSHAQPPTATIDCPGISSL
jgi:hypothetical protein